MAYCAIDDLIKAFTEEKLIQLTDDAGSGAYDAAVLNEEIANAQEEIDPYCRKRYADSMPFVTVPGLLKSICVDIALYRVHKRRGRISVDVKDAYDSAIKKLEGISKGLLDLGTSSGVVAVDEDSVSFTDKTPEDRKFRDPEGY